MAVNKKNDPATIQTVTNGGFKIRFFTQDQNARSATVPGNNMTLLLLTTT